MLETLLAHPIAIGFVVTLVVYYLTRAPSGNEPPSPFGLPVVGHLLFLGRKMNLTLTEYSKKYGPVYQIWIGSRKIVVINGQRAIRAAAASRNFDARPDFMTYKAGFGEYGIPGYPPRARLYKRLTMKAMAVFTVDRKAELEEVAHRAADMLSDELRTKGTVPFDPKETLYRVVWTIMGYVCYGRFFGCRDPEVDQVFKDLPAFAKTLAFGVLVDYFPWAEPLLGSQMKQFKTLMKNLGEYSQRLTRANVESYDPNGKPRNFCDLFRKAALEMTDEEKAELEVSEETLLSMGGSLFGAGFGTIASMTRWATLFLAKHKDVQIKCQQEIDSIIGLERLPRFGDTSSLPYSVATMTELYRKASMAALGITHAAVRDVEFEGFSIREGTPVIFNLWSAHRDVAVYDDPETFKPERFLHEDGSLNKAHVETVMPFGLGARRCGGEPIARLETFLFFVSILQKFTVSENPAKPLDETDYIMGLGLELRPFEVVFEERRIE